MLRQQINSIYLLIMQHYMVKRLHHLYLDLEIHYKLLIMLLDNVHLIFLSINYLHHYHYHQILSGIIKMLIIDHKLQLLYLLHLINVLLNFKLKHNHWPKHYQHLYFLLEQNYYLYDNMHNFIILYLLLMILYQIILHEVYND